MVSVLKIYLPMCYPLARSIMSIGCVLPSTIVLPALLGSFHVAFIIEFADGLEWLLKVLATRH